jgi:phosphopentomutase
VFTNILESDRRWGHRDDVPGFQKGLRESAARLPRLLERVRQEALITRAGTSFLREIST